MPTLTTDPGLTITEFPIVTVSTATSLGGPTTWTVVAHLRCDTLTRAVNGLDTARLSYEIGEGVIQPGQTTFATYTPLALKGKFVRIVMTDVDRVTTHTWIGYVVSDEVSRDGVKDVGGTNKLVGRTQFAECVGLEYFLMRRQIDSAIVRKSGATPNYVRIKRALAFNAGLTTAHLRDTVERGNRSTDTNDDGLYDFTEDFDEVEKWAAVDIVKHCLKYHTMRNKADAAAPCEYILNAADEAAGYLNGFYPELESEQITVFDVLQKIIQPQRGLAWWSQFVDGATATVEIRIASLAGSAVTLPSGGTLPANASQQTLDFDTERDVAHVEMHRLGSRDYHQVQCRGARMTSTCTVGMEDTTLDEDWNQLANPNEAGTEKKYKDAAKGDADYGGLDDTKKKKRNDAMRVSETFYRVYQAFRIPADWNGKTGDGGTAQRKEAFPLLSDTGSVLGSIEWNVEGLRMLNTLRLKRGYDYATPGNPKRVTPTGTPGELAAPFAFIQVSKPTSGGTPQGVDRFQFMHQLNSRSDFADGGERIGVAEPKVNYNLVMQQTVPGLRLEARGGLQHALAYGTWEADNPEPSSQVPEVDYRKLRATVCIEADAFCEHEYPADADLPASVPLEILTIDLGDKYRLDFLAENTVVGLDKGQLVKAGAAAVLRDDRKFLKDMARLAFEWYQTDRQTMKVTFRQQLNLFELGMLITQIGTGSTAQQVNTIVSTITWDLVNGTTTVATDDETLDVRSLV
jgi:hypothetical protein